MNPFDKTEVFLFHSPNDTAPHLSVGNFNGFISGLDKEGKLILDPSESSIRCSLKEGHTISEIR